MPRKSPIFVDEIRYITFVPQNVLHPIRTDGSVAQLDRATAF